MMSLDAFAQGKNIVKELLKTSLIATSLAITVPSDTSAIPAVADDVHAAAMATGIITLKEIVIEDRDEEKIDINLRQAQGFLDLKPMYATVLYEAYEAIEAAKEAGATTEELDLIEAQWQISAAELPLLNSIQINIENITSGYDPLNILNVERAWKYLKMVQKTDIPEKQWLPLEEQWAKKALPVCIEYFEERIIPLKKGDDPVEIKALLDIGLDTIEMARDAGGDEKTIHELEDIMAEKRNELYPSVE